MRGKALAMGQAPWAAPAALTLAAAVATLAVGSQQWLGLDEPDVTTGAILLAVLAATAVLPWRAAAIAAPALVTVWIGGWWAFEQGPEQLDVGVPTQDAVGSAAFYGVPYLDQQLVGAALILLVLAAGAGLTVWLRRRHGDPGPAAEAEPDRPVDAAASETAAPEPDAAEARSRLGRLRLPPPGRRRALWIVVLGWALLTLTLVPDLEAVLIDGSRTPFPGNWDQANLITWNWLQQQGQMPMSDFWYPYGGLWLLGDDPLGPLVRMGYQSYLLALTAWALWRLVGPQPARILPCLLVVVGLGFYDPVDLFYAPTFLRYYPGLLLPVVYAAVGPMRHGRPTRAHLLLVLATASTAFMNTDVFILAAAGIGFVMLGELVFERPRVLRLALAAGAVDAAALLLGLALVLLVWLATGTFEDNARWYSALTGVSASSSSAPGADALVGLDPDPSMATLLLVIPLLLLVAAYAQRHLRSEQARASSLILFAAAGVTSITLAKHLVRPQGFIVLMLPVAALLWSAILLWRPRPVPALTAGLAIGAFVAMLHLTATVTPGDYVSDAVTTPVRVADNAALAAFDRERVRRAGSQRFAPRRFEGVPEYESIAKPYGPALGGPGEHRFATLGDAQILYPALSQLPPQYISLYDAGRVSEQKKLLEALRAAPPAKLVWRHDFGIDGMPYVVRDPLVFRYAIDHYVPETFSSPADILRRRKPREAVAWDYWRGRLNEILDLGFIPGYSKGAELDDCRPGRSRPGCVPYALLSGRAEDGNPVDVRMPRPGGGFTARFAAQSDVRVYAIRLDRLWFWPNVSSRDPRRWKVPPGFEVRVVYKQAGDDLY